MRLRFFRSRIRTLEMDAREAYAHWASNYPPRPHNRLMELEHREVLDLLPAISGLDVVDLACGTGRYLAVLAGREARSVWGIDSSAEMLARAENLPPVTLIQADLLSLPLASCSMDVAVCGLGVGHVLELGKAMGEISRVMKPGGVLVYSDFHPIGSLMGWRRTFHLRDAEEISVRYHTHLYSDHHSACAAAGLTIEQVREPRIDFEHEWRGFPAAIVIRARKRGMDHRSEATLDRRSSGETI